MNNKQFRSYENSSQFNLTEEVLSSRKQRGNSTKILFFSMN